MRSFAGDPALKRELLQALDARIAAASLDLLSVRGEHFAPYEFTRPDTYAIAEKVLRVPEDLLRLGGYLFQGFPEDAASTVEHLRCARGWLAGIPVGVDLGSVTRDFVVWRLTDGRDGMMRFAHRNEVRAVLEEIALALVGHDDTAAGRERAAALAESVRAEIPVQARAGRVDDEVYGHLRALETAMRAADVGCDEHACTDVAQRSVFGAFGVNIPRDWLHGDAMERWLTTCLASMGG